MFLLETVKCVSGQINKTMPDGLKFCEENKAGKYGREPLGDGGQRHLSEDGIDEKSLKTKEALAKGKPGRSVCRKS